MSALQSAPRYAFAGDRLLAVRVLDYLLERGEAPLALMVSDVSRASHASELRARCSHLEHRMVLEGTAFRSPEGHAILSSLRLDFVLSIHFPYLVPPEILALPRIGVLNLHPALLPWNRGWHTPSWSILEDTPAGATLHFMDEGLDTGDIVHQREIEVSPVDTADSLYRRILDLEYDVFREAWPDLAAGQVRRTPQDPQAGTGHRRSDLLSDDLRRIDPARSEPAGHLLRRLRALTTSDAAEAAFVEIDGQRYAIRLDVQPLDPGEP